MFVVTFRYLLRDESGATAVEYGLIVALVSMAMVVSLNAIGESHITIFNTLANAVNSTNPALSKDGG